MRFWYFILVIGFWIAHSSTSARAELSEFDIKRWHSKIQALHTYAITATIVDRDNKTMELWVDEEKWYLSQRTKSRLYKEAFDGTITRILHTNTERNESFGKLGPGRFSEVLERDVDFQSMLPFQFGYGLLGRWLYELPVRSWDYKEELNPQVGYLQIYGLRVSPKTSNDANMLLVVDAIPSDGSRFDRFHLLLDPQMDYAVVRKQRFNPENEIILDLSGSEYKQFDGIWLPRMIKGTQYFRQGANIVVEQPITIKLDDVKIDEMSKPERFTIQWPDNCIVYDNLTATTVQGSILEPVIRRSLKRIGVSVEAVESRLSSRSNTIPPSIMSGTVRTNERITIPTILWTCSIGAIGLLALFIARRKRRLS